MVGAAEGGCAVSHPDLVRVSDVSAEEAELHRQIAQLRAEREHAVAEAFWRGVCSTWAAEADERARSYRALEDHHRRGGMDTDMQRDFVWECAEWAAMFEKRAATLRAWALAEVTR